VISTVFATVDLSLLEAIILGLVEGLSEYLPISSTGHLLVTTEVLGISDGSEEVDAALDAYAICIQAGAILAVLVVYRERIQQMIEGLLGRSDEGKRVLAAVVMAFIPTALIALAIQDFVRERLFGPLPIAIAWLVGGVGILALSRAGFLDRNGIELGDITIRHALIIGVLQAIAIWPGVSRSLVTILAGVLIGLTLRAAVEFSFLLGLITLGAATVYEGLDQGPEMIDLFGWFTPLVGLVVAFVSAVLAVKWMVTWLNERGFDVFGWYRIAIGTIALGAIGAGWL
jgi:undecaprenyl-diphosphatase